METTYPIWHPFTQMKTAGLPLKVRRGNGEFLELEDGRQIIDCIASWWVTLHGHANQRIADAIAEQARTLEQVIFAGFTHEPAERLAHGLLGKLPSKLTKVFFSDNGSTSVEVALKMAYQYWLNTGKTGKSKFIGFEGGYHGDTLGAMSAGGSSTFWKPFRNLMFDINVVPYPQTWDGDQDVADKEAATLDALRSLLQSCDQYAAIIIEPLVQGAAGMHMCRPEFIQSLRQLADQYDVLLIFDEVMTGFGRTGDWFASTKCNTTPDIICLSKGLTGGFLPLSVTVSTDEIYDAFYADELEKALFHSHSYTGNPLACAAANASLQLLEETSNLFYGMERRHQRLFDRYLQPLQLLEHRRHCGTVVAFDVAGANTSYYSEFVPQLRAKFLSAGLLLRPLGNTIYLMPPLCISDHSLEQVYETIATVLSPVAV